MSLVKITTVKSSRWCNGEDESERSLGTTVKNGTYLNNYCCAQHHGGVGGRGMQAREMGIKVETCDGEPRGSNARTSVQNARRAPAAAGVGAAHSSNEGGNDAGAKGPHLNEANRERKEVVMAPQGANNTRGKAQEVRRRLCRQAKRSAGRQDWGQRMRRQLEGARNESEAEERSRKAGCGKSARPV